METGGDGFAQAVLDDWANMLPKFWQVVPPSESMTPEVVGDQSMVATTA
jgi:glutamate synthase (ferredoxin)